jgi:hypothetical protein
MHFVVKVKCETNKTDNGNACGVWWDHTLYTNVEELAVNTVCGFSCPLLYFISRQPTFYQLCKKHFTCNRRVLYKVNTCNAYYCESLIKSTNVSTKRKQSLHLSVAFFSDQNWRLHILCKQYRFSSLSRKKVSLCDHYDTLVLTISAHCGVT